MLGRRVRLLASQRLGLTPWWVGKQYKCEGYGRSTECYCLAEIQLHGWWLCPHCYENAVNSKGAFRATANAVRPLNLGYDPALG